MYKRFHAQPLVLMLLAVFLILLCGCGSNEKTLPQASGEGYHVRNGKMLHLKQVLERYDASGQPVPQYYELWLANKKGLCIELDKDGNELGRTLDADDRHFVYSLETGKGIKYDASRMFTLNFEKLRAASTNVKQSADQQYAGRKCAIYLLENDGSEEWMKVYVDRETGYVLLCDAPLFRIRTALLEVLPIDNRLFKAPSDIAYK